MADKKDDHQYLILKKVKGINTQPSREALGPDEFAWLENMMPIGDAFIKAVPAKDTATATITSSIQSMHGATLGSTDYQIAFTTSGGAQAVNLGSGSVVEIFASGMFSGTPSMDQWKSERIVITDTMGMFSWDGSISYIPGGLATISVYVTGVGYTATPVVTITGGGGSNATAVATLAGDGVSAVNLVAVGSGFTSIPTIGFTGGTAGTAATASAYIMPSGMAGDAIAVYSGRTWVANGRLLSYTAPNTWYDVNTANAAGSTTITEGSLRRKIYGLKALDNYLYVFGDASIIIVGDLKVSGTVTTFSLTFLSSTTGTTLPGTITAMERAIIFANQEGVWAMFGASLQKISNPLDGIFPAIDFTSNPSGGLAAIYNILCYVLSFRYAGGTSSRALQALFFNGKWFLTSQGDSIAYVSPIQRAGIHELWCSSGTDVSRMYADDDAAIAQMMQTGLYDLGNPIFDKLVIAAGIEYTAPAAASLTFQIDTESQTTSTSSVAGSTLTWYNNSGVVIDWRNNANQQIVWVATAFLLDYFPAAISGKYLGATVTSTSPQLEINGILMEYKRQAAWGR